MCQRLSLKLIILFLAALLALNIISLLPGIHHFEKKQRETLAFTPPIFEEPIIKGNKWIVVTSIQYPTEDVKKLARQKGWNLLVVADRKTPQDWNYTNVHFLSVEKQTELFGNFSEQMPLNSYTRKNLGYLYAIKCGAEWIYDTDDDNKPYGLGLNQFDYSKTISGLRYRSSSSRILVEKLFNPYRYFGFSNMWPRGFPLEYLEEHSNGKNRTISCRTMQRPAVQQGIVKVDPDVDAIYRLDFFSFFKERRLLYAKEGKGLKVRFNPIVPPIVLEKGTYSPWNSQNTLFHYKAFFILYLPTTVAFRSFFGQKLLHLIGENIAFYPVNAVQYRNAHNYLKDFDQEIDVYEKSGKIINFLDSWICSKHSIDLCMLDLAKAFAVEQFFQQEDYNLISRWIKALKAMDYAFPEMIENIYEIEQTNETEIFNSTKNEPVFQNCREVNLDLGVDIYHSREEPGLVWAADALNGFSEILSWLGNETTLPPRAFLEKYHNSPALNSKNNTVLVLVNNYEWYGHLSSASAIGLLQRLYSPFFKATILCGPYSPSKLKSSASTIFPPIEPLNYINITEEEMQKGWHYSHCVSKVRDLRLANVDGYYFVSDDTIFNLWHNLPQHKPMNPIGVGSSVHYDPEKVQIAVDLIEGKYQDDENLQRSWKKHLEMLDSYRHNGSAREHFIYSDKSVLSDFIFLPSKEMDLISDLLEVLSEAGNFVEVSLGKVLDAYDYSISWNFAYLWYEKREYPFDSYNRTIYGLHPVKLSEVFEKLNFQEKYCSTVITAFHEELYT